MSWATWDDGGTSSGGGTAQKSSTTNARRRPFRISWGGGIQQDNPTGNFFEGATVTPYQHSSPQGGYGAPNGQFGSGEWWSSPGMRFNEQGHAWDPTAGAYRTVQMPNWAGSMESNPQAFYELYQSVPENYRAAWKANMVSDYDANNKNMEQLAAGRKWLTGAMGDVDRARTGWANDPYRQQVMQGLSERASPEYEFFSGPQRTAMEDPIRQGYAMSDIAHRGAAAGHGTSQGGGAAQGNQALAVQAATGGNQLRAQIDAEEQKLKNEALSALAGTTASYNAADSQYVNAGNQLAGALASLESGVQFDPTDYTIWPALNDATQRADEEAEFRDRAMTAMEEEARFGLDDLTETLLSSLGSGLWDFIL